MPTPRINGTLAPIAKAPVIEYDPNRGKTTRLEWESAGDGLGSTALELTSQRVAYTFTKSRHVSRIIANETGSQAGEPEVTTDSWQVLANEIQKDLREFPGFQAMEASYANTIGYVVRDVDLYNQGLAAGTPAPAAGAAPESGYLFKLLKSGQTHYALGQYVLRHTTNVANDYAANIADVNVNRCYTTAQLIAEVTDASLWTHTLPGRLIYKIQNIPVQTAKPDHQWGWRKLPSPEVTAADNRIEIVTEYWLEQWHTFLYPPVT